MPRKIQNCKMEHLISVPLPTHGVTYTVITHQFVIDYSKQQLIAAGFDIVDEEYRCTADGQIAQGIYKLNYNSDPELSMMFAWTNSYNKQVKFKCLIGAYINRTGTVMTSGDLGTWIRKHTGTADIETKDMIDNQIQNANMYYDQLVSDKAVMEGISLNKRRQAQMLGILFAEFQILTTEQASMIRQQMDRPITVYADKDSLWAFYNHVTLSLQYSHPRTWLEDQRVLHYFIDTIGNFQQCSAPAQIIETVDIVDEVIEDVIDPNQISILDQIADLEADQIDEDIRYTANEDDVVAELYGVDNDIEVSIPGPCAAHDAETEREIGQENSTDIFPQDEIVEYTDPAGDTFELPMIKESQIPQEIMDALMNAPEMDVSKVDMSKVTWVDDSDTVQYTDPAGNTFELPIIEELSLAPSPADYELLEAIEASEGVSIVADLDSIPIEKPVIKKEEEVINFDLDLSDEDTEESGDNIPDFF